MNRSHGALAGAIAWFLLLPLSGAHASVLSATVTQRITLPEGAGMPYERLKDTYEGELDPGDPRNTLINDLERAPHNARGKVEYSATFRVVRPVDHGMHKGRIVN